MKIGIITANQEIYVKKLVCFLIYKLQKPDYVILVKNGLFRRVRRNFSLRGILMFLRERFSDVSFNKTYPATDHLANFLESQKVFIPADSLVQICKQKRIEIIRVTDLDSKRTLRILRKANIDLLINAGGGIYKLDLINVVNFGILNAHMGLLPDFRGMNVLEWSVFNNKLVGVTLHMIDQGIDTGDILSFRRISVEKDDSIDDLRNKSAIANFLLFTEIIAGFNVGVINRKKQQLQAGKQYFVMHPRLRAYVENKLSDYKKNLLEPAGN
ncbi:MAG: hypothetical protein GX876_03815 [Bacteroidales bacterium]|nr:hypothetical protein [Bacteroidales bacterium]